MTRQVVTVSGRLGVRVMGSLLVHAAVVAVLVVFATRPVAEPPRPAPTVEILTVDPPHPVRGAEPGSVAPAPVPVPLARAVTAPHHERTPAAPKPANPFDELTRTVDTPAASSGDMRPDGAVFGNGFDGPAGNGVGASAGKMGIPSFARPPRPREDYSHARGSWPPEYGGQGVVVALSIDDQGHVTNARLVRGLGVASIDEHVMRLSSEFEFWPALDDLGQPIPVRLDWLFVLPGNPVAQAR